MRAEPSPLLTTLAMGQPMLMSMKSQPEISMARAAPGPLLRDHCQNLSSYHRAFVFPQKPEALPVPVHQGPGGYHLRYCEAGAHSGAYGSKRPVRHSGHGRQGQVAGNG